ncbi:MAG TPA: MMPL family transporter, partial [Thermoplasmata archaeon]|nr:MMPL family transporter [Thermoplasmata archaeon]
MVPSAEVPLGAGGRAFQRLGRAVVARPWRPIIVWGLLLVFAIPLLVHLGGSTQNSATKLPDSSPSSMAAAELDREFPSGSAPSSSLLLFTGSNLTDPTGQHVVESVTTTLLGDPKLTHLAGVRSLYTTYASYLEGQATLAEEALVLSGIAADPGNTTAPVALGLWGPPAQFLATWQAEVAAHPATPPASWNYPSWVATSAALNGSVPRAVLGAFYNGTPGTSAGFNATAPINGSGACAGAPATVEACVDATVRATEGRLLPALLPAEPGRDVVVLGRAVLRTLGVGNFSDPTAVLRATDTAVALGSGLPEPFLALVGASLGNGPVNASAIDTWAAAVTEGPVADYPLPIPRGIAHQFVAPDGSATLVLVTFSESDSATTPAGGTPIFDDVREIDRVVPLAVLIEDPSGGIGYVQTGPAPLDADESAVLSANLAIVLPLTIAVLVIITVLYFRSPISPMVTFTGLGAAIGLGLAGLVGISWLFGKVDQTAITLETTFVLGVGTDYSIFLVARYREEIRRGAESREAVVTAVTWAGQSIATSGGTAILATLALAFSGVGLLSQWGETLSLAVFITVLVALTLVPALLTLIGPRVFWPEVGTRADRAAAAAQQRYASGAGYFQRAGALTQRRPALLIALILLCSVPLAYVAVTAPLSYDFYQQLPAAPGPTDGLTSLGTHFGAGDAFPMQVLVTFPSPLLNGTTPNATEFAELSEITGTINGTSGVDSVQSPIGP